MPPIFPELPILTPDPPRKSQAQKYGGLFYLGIAGLLLLLGLVGWFALGVWSHREVWDAIYRLHDTSRTEDERIQAAYLLSRDPRVNTRQRYDMIERQRGLPPLARYLLAESLTPEAAAGDPRVYALAVARSRGWPDWLRILLLRPLAYGAGTGLSIPAGPLEELGRYPDPILALWAEYASGAMGDERAARRLEDLARAGGPRGEQARLLTEALKARRAERTTWLDRASRRLREDHPGAAGVWAGWVERDGRLTRGTAPDLQRSLEGPTTGTIGRSPDLGRKERQR